MENDEALTADANLNITSKLYSQRLDHASHRARDAADAASGATEVHKDSDHEDTPLLSRNIEEDLTRHSSSHDGEQDPEETEWSGAKEFEGRPWWNRPSVSPRAYPSISSYNKRLSGVQGVLVITTVFPLYSLLWGHNCSEAQPHLAINMSRLPCGYCSKRPKFPFPADHVRYRQRTMSPYGRGAEKSCKIYFVQRYHRRDFVCIHKSEAR